MVKKMTISHKNILPPHKDDFVDQNILSHDEIFSFDEDDIESLKYTDAFSNDATLKPCNLKYQPDFISSYWVCFP